ncbi:MAG: YkgJ family cysteine cluster protein [Zoogloeaceae bacterium]|nr:YkgJ family cysteine cluster protein [Zoogloeaceae bacterium]
MRLDLRATEASSNPCLTCGACCASYRVDFHPSELAGGIYAWGAGVPRDYALTLTPRLMRMRGTDASPPRCLALNGEIGVRVACAVYAGRPSPCRDFLPEHEACQRARRRLGLPARAMT